MAAVIRVAIIFSALLLSTACAPRRAATTPDDDFKATYGVTREQHKCILGNVQIRKVRNEVERVFLYRQFLAGGLTSLQYYDQMSALELKQSMSETAASDRDEIDCIPEQR